MGMKLNRSLRRRKKGETLLADLSFQLFGCWISKHHILQVSTLNAGTLLSEILVRLP